jgi:hypothetical protein
MSDQKTSGKQIGSTSMPTNNKDIHFPNKKEKEIRRRKGFSWARALRIGFLP